MGQTRSEKIVFKLKSPRKYSEGDFVYSRTMGPPRSFKWRLKVYPSGTLGTASQNGKNLSAFVEVISPSSDMPMWECKSVRYLILAINRDEENTICKMDAFTFNAQKIDRGWHCIVPISLLADSFYGFVDENDQMEIRAEVHGLPPAPNPLVSWDLTAELKPLSFRLASGPPLFFDQRLLTARCEYFQKMLDETATWKESSVGEVDLRSDPHASQESVLAVLGFLVADVFDPKDVSLALSVRAMADRFCIVDLVKCADDALASFLSEDNVLTLLGELLDTGSEVEAACWKMLESDSKLLVKQQAMLDQLIEQQPALAKRLILKFASLIAER
ncbi:unnamed protein product [Cladocopium goreaui]|uniref:MATH domain-containing protein n=1 Tax=Cladocopium goreaui TaxID=2562237 RepID=A0A9P1D3C5_9DINO|nr:unnamed protein product [Cladocopium goreaui]